MKTNNLFNLVFYNESKDTLIYQYIYKVIKSSSPTQRLPVLIFTPNPEQIMLAHRNSEFASALQSADILIPDGVGVVAASKFLAVCGKGAAIRERISGIDLFQNIVERFPETKSVVIGGHSNTRVTVSGVAIPSLSAYQRVQVPTEGEEKLVDAFLTKERPEVVFVAFGAPYQEYWAIRHRAQLEKVGVKLVMVVGGAADVLSGKLKRAPKLFRSLGLEWLFRLIQEPWRWKRQLNLVQFIALTLRTALRD